MPQVACGATPAPSLTLRVGKWDDSNCGDASAQAQFPGGVQRVVSEIGWPFFSCRAISLLRIHWPLTTILSLHAPRLTPQASSLTSGVRSCADRPPLAILPSTDHRIVKIRTGLDLDERSLYFSVAPNRAIPTEKNQSVFPRSPPLDRRPCSRGRRRSTPVAPGLPAGWP